MLNFTNLFDLQIMMFLLMGIGFFLRKKRFLSTESRKTITELVINIILPCNIINSFIIKMNFHIIISSFTILIVSFVIQIFCILGSKILYKKFSHNKRMVLEYGTICSNAGFMGNPLVEGLYGSTGLLFASIYLIPLRISMWSAGVSCFTTAKGKEVIKKVVTHPCIIAVFIGLALMFSQLQLPSFALKTIQTVGSCTTALSMLVIGAILADIRMNTVLSKGTAYYTFIRLVLIPGLVLGFCYLLHLNSLVSAVSAVLAGMPAGTTTAILASKYDGDEQFAVKCIFLSTILSMVTIPLLCMLIEYIY